MGFLNPVSSAHKIKAQGYYTLEYAVFIFVVIVALLGMFMYLKFSLAGRWRESIDSIGDGRLYHPYRTTINATAP